MRKKVKEILTISGLCGLLLTWNGFRDYGNVNRELGRDFHNIFYEEYRRLWYEDNQRTGQEMVENGHTRLEVLTHPYSKTLEETEPFLEQAGKVARAKVSEKAEEMVSTTSLIFNPGKYFAAKKYITE